MLKKCPSTLALENSCLKSNGEIWFAYDLGK
jgi:hypothetical protein